ncbi:hypothetical protein ACHWQZ_G006468 [Mnemiopsis leidyi]
MISNYKPEITQERLKNDLQKLYNLNAAKSKELQSYDDTMFVVTTEDDKKYIAKCYNPLLTDRHVLEKIMETLVQLEKFNVPRPVPQISGDLLSEIVDTNSSAKVLGYFVVYQYISGKTLGSEKKDPQFWRKLGKMVAKISEKMSEIKSEDFVRHHSWDPLEAIKTLDQVKEYFPGDKVTTVDVNSVIATQKHIHNVLKEYPVQLIHSDVNEYNVIVGEGGEPGIIDFNDLTRSYRVFDLGHCVGYMVEAQDCDLYVGRYVVEGYSSVIELSDTELSLLYDIVVARFTLSVSIGNKDVQLGLANEYVTKCVADNSRFLSQLTTLGREAFNKVILGI